MTINKILFFAPNQDIKIGSYRIWINNLNIYLNKIGVNSKISKDERDIVDSDIVIIQKGYERFVSKFKRKYPDKLIGIINISPFKERLADFVIVGSIEEQDSLSKYKNVFLFPLIENMYQDQRLKEHSKKDILKFCYHGSYTHLASFSPHLKEALEEFSREQRIELLILTDNNKWSKTKWKTGRPEVEIIFKQWDANTVKADLASCDIGLVPNINLFKAKHLLRNSSKGIYNTDYLIRFKNKSNAGRSFVFHQLGLPVVADITPSNLHILGNPDCGYAVLSTEAWLKSFRKLSSADHRNFIAKNARNEFDRLYNSLDWTRRLVNQISELKADF